MTTFSYLRQLKYENEQEKRRQEEAERRARMMEDKQMQLLDAQIAEMQNQPGGVNAQVREQAAKEAANYLGKWNNILQKAEGVYSTAISDVDKAGNLIDRAYGDLGKLDEISADVSAEWDSFKNEFGGMKSDFLGAASDSLADRGTLRRQFMDLTRMDQEGAAGRAMADVAGQAEAGRRAEAMRLQGLGIDPTSGRYRSLMQESRDREALGKTMAGNKARLEEKNRVAGLTAKGLELIDPTKDLGAATQIQQLSNDLLGQRTNIATTRAGLATDLARSRGALATTRSNIAGDLATRIGGQYGEYGAAQRGVQYANTGTASSPSGAMTAGEYAKQVGATVIGSGANRPLTDTIRAHLDAQAKAKAAHDRYYG